MRVNASDAKSATDLNGQRRKPTVGAATAFEGGSWVHWGQARIPDGLIRSDVPAGTHTGGFRDEIDGCC
jgi:hypothetical protein